MKNTHFLFAVLAALLLSAAPSVFGESQIENTPASEIPVVSAEMIESYRKTLVARTESAREDFRFMSDVYGISIINEVQLDLIKIEQLFAAKIESLKTRDGVSGDVTSFAAAYRKLGDEMEKKLRGSDQLQDLPSKVDTAVRDRLRMMLAKLDSIDFGEARFRAMLNQFHSNKLTVSDKFAGVLIANSMEEAEIFANMEVVTAEDGAHKFQVGLSEEFADSLTQAQTEKLRKILGDSLGTPMSR